MNHLLFGTGDKRARYLEVAGHGPHFMLIDDGPLVEPFLDRFPKAKLFDVSKHHFNPLKGMTYPRARDIAATLYSFDPEAGKSTLTVRNGRRALARIFYQSRPKRLDKLPDS